MDPQKHRDFKRMANWSLTGAVMLFVLSMVLLIFINGAPWIAFVSNASAVVSLALAGFSLFLFGEINDQPIRLFLQFIGGIFFLAALLAALKSFGFI